MMQIVYFSQKRQFLSLIEGRTGEKIYVTPSPAKADNLRTQLKDTTSQDVITIAKFTSNLLELLWSEDERPQIKRKADLLLIFGILKNKYFPSLGFEQFLQAYNLFSDLRSFTLNEEALTSVLDEQPAEIKSTVSFFWKLLELTGYSDEHGAYQRIAEKLRSDEERPELKKIFIFWGFQHLNGQQLDLLKALSIRYQIIVPFPLALKDKLKRSDWPSWLIDHKVEEILLPEVERSPKADWLTINSREISLYLKERTLEGTQIILGVSKLSSSFMNIVPHGEVNFKIPHVLLEGELQEIESHLQHELADTAGIEEFKQWISEKRQKLISNFKLHLPFKRLKALQLYEEAVQVIAEMTDEEVKMDFFFKKLLREVVALNQPRTSFVPMLKDKGTVELKDMSSLEDIDHEKEVIVCIDERFEDIQSLGQNYSEAIQKELSALGPLKRNDLELLFKQWEFKELFSRAKVLVLMPESVLKHNLIWKRLFNGIVLQKIDHDREASARKLKENYNEGQRLPYQKHFSASRLQTYIDCPRKFYYTYVDKIVPSVALESDIDHMLSGTIIHKLIEEFMKRGLTENELPGLTREIFDQIISERKLQLTEETYLKRELIFNHRAMNGLQFLKKIQELTTDKIEWRIEENFQDESLGSKMIGTMDCLGVGSRHVFLLDFKSSQASASSNTDVEEMESLQLWVYALAARLKVEDLLGKSIVFGYVVLDDPTKSNLLTNDNEIYEVLKSNKFCRPKMLKEDFAESLKLAEEKIKVLMQAIQNDSSFQAKPRKVKDCHFCELNKVCVKSELSHV